MRLFFTTDIHGSEKCFLKFLNAGAFYGAQVIVLGGDITGKMMVPVIREANGRYRTKVHDREHVATTEREREELEKQIRFSGFYPYRTTREELEELRKDEQRVQAIFTRLMIESVARWVEIAEAKLRGTGTLCFVQPGNDDEPVIDEVLAASNVLVNPESTVVDLPEGYRMASTGHANQTPWSCPRDLPEEDLANRIQRMLAGLTDMSKMIFNFHCPPHDTVIDYAPQLDSQLRPVMGAGGEPNMVPVGSTAVRSAIERHQPVLGLHGHIHESRGVAHIGGTLCINPGSRYNEGVLQGVILELDGGRVRNYQLTAG